MSISEEIRKPTLEPLRIYMEPMPYKQNAHPEDAKTGSGNAQREDRSPLSGLAHPANAGVTQRLECNPYKVEVAGPNPAARTIPPATPKPKVKIGNKVFLYEAKAPFSPSGKSLLGALEYRPESEEMRCHECGEWFVNLSRHLKAHRVTAREYKVQHGLKQSTALVSDGVRAVMSESAKRSNPLGCVDMRSAMIGRKPSSPEVRKASAESGRNARGLCRLQILDKIKRMAALLGKTPRLEDMVGGGINYWDIRYYFGAVKRAQKLAGLTPNTPKEALSDEFLIQQLRIFFYNNKRIPRQTDIRRGMMACGAGPFYRAFGSFSKSIHIAFSPREIAKDGFWKSPKNQAGRKRAA